jgi:hypothetical protein
MPLSIRFAMSLASEGPVAGSVNGTVHVQGSRSESAASDLSAMLSIDSISLHDSVSVPLSASASVDARAFAHLDSATASLNNSFATANAQVCAAPLASAPALPSPADITQGTQSTLKYPNQDVGVPNIRQWSLDHPSKIYQI